MRFVTFLRPGNGHATTSDRASSPVSPLPYFVFIIIFLLILLLLFLHLFLFLFFRGARVLFLSFFLFFLYNNSFVLGATLYTRRATDDESSTRVASRCELEIVTRVFFF